MKLLKIIVILVMNVIIVSVALTAPSSKKNAFPSKILAIQKPSLKNKLMYLKSFDGIPKSFKGSDIWMMDPANSKSVKKLTKIGGIYGFTISYDLTKMIVFQGERNDVYLIDLLTGKEKHLGRNIGMPSLSPSNDKAITTGYAKGEFYSTPFVQGIKEYKVSHLWLIDVLRGGKFELYEDSPGRYALPQWSPDGSKISFAYHFLMAREEDGIYVVDMHNISVRKKIVHGSRHEWADNKTLIIDEDKKVVFYNIDSLKIIKEVKIDFMWRMFSFAPPDGFYYEDESDNPYGDISYVDMKTLQKRKIVEDAIHPVFGK